MAMEQLIGYAESLNTKKGEQIPEITIPDIVKKISNNKTLFENGKKTSSIYEWLSAKQPLKLYIDIDVKGTHDKPKDLTTIFKWISNYFKGANLKYVVSSCSDKKKNGQPFYGSHIIFPHIIISDILYMKTIVQKMINETNIDYIDIMPYGNTQKFRLPYSRKDETNHRPYVMSDPDDDILDHIIQVNNHNAPIYEIEIKEEEKAIQEDRLNAKVDRRLKTIEPILKSLDEGFYEEYENWWKIGQAVSNYMGKYGKEAFRSFSARSKNWETRHRANFDGHWDYFMKNTMANKYKSFNLKWLKSILNINFDSNGENAFSDVHITMNRILPLVKEKCVVIHGDELGKTKCYKTLCSETNIWLPGISAFKKLIIDLCLKEADGPEQRALGYIKQVIELLEVELSFIQDPRIKKMDTLYPHYLPFKNGILDLSTGDLIPHKAEYYISKYIDYDYKHMSLEEVYDTDFYKTLKKVFVDTEMLNFAIRTMCTTLLGENLQKVIIWTGVGGNGKGWLGSVMEKALTGEFLAMGNTSILTSPESSGPNPALANLHLKRGALFNEPASKTKINNEMLKKLTGGDKITARGLYDAITEKENHSTIIIQANTVPHLMAQPSEADERRWVFVLFESLFRLDLEKDDIEQKLFKGDPNVDSYKFKEKAKIPFINLMRHYATEYLKNKKIVEPQASIQFKKKYFNACNPFTEFLEERLEKGDDHDIITIKELLREFKIIEGYSDLPKIERRTHTEKGLKEIIRKSPIWSRVYYDRKKINSIDHCSIILGYRLTQGAYGKDSHNHLLDELDK